MEETLLTSNFKVGMEETLLTPNFTKMNKSIRWCLGKKFFLTFLEKLLKSATLYN